MIVCRQDWIYFKVENIMSIGGIHLSDSHLQEKKEVKVLEIGPDVEEIKKDDKLIIVPKDIIRYESPEAKDKEVHGFVRERDVVALLK